MSVDHKYIISLIHQDKLNEAHECIQKYTDTVSCLIHAYIHRAEDDYSNANYWYKKANVQQPGITLSEELKELEKIS